MRLPFRLIGKRDERAVALDDLADPPLLAEFGALVLELDHDLAAPALARALLDREASRPVARPQLAGLRLPPRVGVDLDGLGHHERRVEPDAELADQPGGLLVALAEGLEEGLGPGMGDRAEVLDQLGLGHPDAEVLDREGLGLVVGRDVDLELELVVEDVLLGELQVALLLEGVGGVRDQLPHEDLLLRVEGVDDDIEQLLDLGLELEGLWSGGGHGCVKRGTVSLRQSREKSTPRRNGRRGILRRTRRTAR